MGRAEAPLRSAFAWRLRRTFDRPLSKTMTVSYGRQSCHACKAIPYWNQNIKFLCEQPMQNYPVYPSLSLALLIF